MDGAAVIIVTRLNGSQFSVNPDLLQRIDSTPDTVLTLFDGTRYLVLEPMDEVIERIIEYRATLIARAQTMQPGQPLRVVVDRAQEAPLDPPVPLRPWMS
jgi:flagellar protein FlbD